MLLVFGLSQPSIRLVRSYAFDNQHSTAQHGFNSVFFLFLSLLFSIVHTALVQLYWCIKFMSMYFSLVFILNVLYIEPMHLETLVSLVLKITQKIVTFQSSHYIAFSILRIVFFFVVLEISYRLRPIFDKQHSIVHIKQTLIFIWFVVFSFRTFFGVKKPKK